MRDLVGRNRPSRACLHGGHRRGLAVQGRELDLERLPVCIHVNRDCSPFFSSDGRWQNSEPAIRAFQLSAMALIVP
jgi:hypothetical protein